MPRTTAASASPTGSFGPISANRKTKSRRRSGSTAALPQLTNADKITMIYSLDTHYLWTFELSNPSWNFPSGSKFDVSFGNRDRGFFRQRVAALDPQLVRVLLPDSVNSFEVFRRLFKLDVVAGGLTTQFDLAYANQVLLALTQCVTKFGTTAKSKAAVAAWLKSPIGPAAEASPDPAILKETADLASAIVAEGEIAKAAALKPDEVPDGVSGDTVWKVADNLFTISVLPKDAVPAEIGDLNDLIVGGDAQKCRGDFFAAAMLDVVETPPSLAPTRIAGPSRQRRRPITSRCRAKGRAVFHENHCDRRRGDAAHRPDDQGARRQGPQGDHSGVGEALALAVPRLSWPAPGSGPSAVRNDEVSLAERPKMSRRAPLT